MASSTRPGTTAPKGRPTRARNDDRSRSLFGSSIQWIVLIVLVVVIVGVVLYLTRDVRSTLGGTRALSTFVVDARPVTVT